MEYSGIKSSCSVSFCVQPMAGKKPVKVENLLFLTGIQHVIKKIRKRGGVLIYKTIKIPWIWKKQLLFFIGSVVIGCFL